MKLPLVPIKDSIATRLLKVVFSFYLILATIVTLSHMIAEYIHTKNLVTEELLILEKTFQPTLQQALWEMNKDQLHSTIKGIIELPNVVGVQVRDPKGKLLGQLGEVLPVATTEPLDALAMNSKTIKNSSGLYWNTFQVSHVRGEESFVVGGVTVYSSRLIVIEKVKYSFLFLIINAIVKIIGFWILFLLVSRTILSRPLAEMTHATHQLDLNNLEDFNFRFRTRGRDELKVLQKAFNSMIQKLLHMRSELYRSNEQLEIRVNERTAELSATMLELEGLNKLALDANPITGLPGNNSLADAITLAIEKKQALSVIYADLDNFKPFNDKYGFAHGDKVISFTSKLLKQSLKNTPDSFIGHIGGDDFIVLVPISVVKEICKKVCQLFDEGIVEFYDKDDQLRGHILAKDRSGKNCAFPIISISLGVVNLGISSHKSYLEVNDACAEVKKAAKKIKGSSIYFDKRNIQK